VGLRTVEFECASEFFEWLVRRGGGVCYVWVVNCEVYRFLFISVFFFFLLGSVVLGFCEHRSMRLLSTLCGISGGRRVGLSMDLTVVYGSVLALGVVTERYGLAAVFPSDVG